MPKRKQTRRMQDLKRLSKRVVTRIRRIASGIKFQTAMAMLNDYIDQGAPGLSPAWRRRVKRAQAELKAAFAEPTIPPAPRLHSRRSLPKPPKARVRVPRRSAEGEPPPTA